MGYTPKRCKELDRTEQLTHAHTGLAVLGLQCCMWAFSSCSQQGLLSSCGGLASHCGGFSGCGMWILSGAGIEPVFLTLAGGFSTTGPPGKPQNSLLMQLVKLALTGPLVLNLCMWFNKIS